MTSPTTAAQIARFLEILCDEAGDKTMPVQQIRLLLALFTYGTIQQLGMEKHTGVERSSNSRNVLKLGPGEDPVKKPGLGLVESYDDLVDRRTKMVRLTPKGYALIRKSLEVLEAPKQ